MKNHNSAEKNDDGAKIPVIVFFAPTASGKTALMKDLFSPLGSHFILNAEIISADSQQVYKFMNIGTAKPDSAFMDDIPHHLVDFLSPSEQFNVSDFVDMADAACTDIFSRGKIPVVCGGTGFYVRNFLFGVSPTPESNPKIREKLLQRAKNEGSAVLYEELKKIDAESAKKIHQNDIYRICRALEVYYISGKTRSSYKIENQFRSRYRFLFIILKPPRELLYEKIAQRVDVMFKEGLKGEVCSLVQMGFDENSPGMKAIGYREWFECGFFEEPKSDGILESKISDLIKHHSCKYAKKQYTYISDINAGNIIEYTASNDDIMKIQNLIKNFIS